VGAGGGPKTPLAPPVCVCMCLLHALCAVSNRAVSNRACRIVRCRIMRVESCGVESCVSNRAVSNRACRIVRCRIVRCRIVRVESCVSNRAVSNRAVSNKTCPIMRVQSSGVESLRVQSGYAPSKVIEQGNNNYFLTFCENRSREVRGTVCQRKFVKREGFLVGREYRVSNSTWYSSPT